MFGLAVFLVAAAADGFANLTQGGAALDGERRLSHYPTPENWERCFRRAARRAQRGEIANYDGDSFEKVPMANKIVCPFVTALIQNQDLEFDEDTGEIGTKCRFATALARTGAISDDVPRAFLGPRAEDVENQFVVEDLFDMVGGPIEHFTDTRIRSDKCCDKDKFDEMAAFANKKDRMTYKRLNRFIEALPRDPDDPDTGFIVLPGMPAVVSRVFGILLAIFGRGNNCPTGRCWLDVQDLKRLFLKGKYPKNWQHRFYTVADVNSQIQRICDAGPELGNIPCETLDVA